MPNRSTPARVTAPSGYSQDAFASAVRARQPVAESAPAIEAPTERVTVREADPSGATVTRPGRLAIRLIRAGWSLNSNFYPAEVLRRDGPAAWPAGTQCMADHATDDEEAARPAGSVRAVAAVLTSDARWDEGQQALMAEVRLLHPWRDTITDMARAQAEEGVPVIGMSIRAWVTGEHGEHEGREGFIVQSIPEGRSVDFVTKPAAGGGIVSVLESVGNTVPVGEARNVAHWFEARLHRDFTERADDMFGDGRLTRDERITLSGAVGDALSAFAARIEADAPQLLSRDLWEEPPQPTAGLAAEAAPEVPADTEPPPTPEAVQAAPNTVTDGAPPTAPNPPIEKEPAMSGTTTGVAPVEAGTAPVVDTAPTTTAEAQPNPATVAALEAVTAQLAQMQTALTAVQAANTAREADNRALRNRERAAEAVTAALRAAEHADVSAQITPRVTSRVLAQVPTTAEGVVDEAALTAAIAATIADEAAYVRGARAEALEAAGVGQPYGLGAARQESPKDDGFDAELKSFFSDTLGLTEAQAKIAATGRG